MVCEFLVLAEIGVGGTGGGVLWGCLVWKLLAKGPSLVSGFDGSVGIDGEVDVTVDVGEAVGSGTSTLAVWFDGDDDVARKRQVLLHDIAASVQQEVWGVTGAGEAVGDVAVSGAV